MVTRQQKQEQRWAFTLGYVQSIAEDPAETEERRMRAGKALAALEGRTWP